MVPDTRLDPVFGAVVDATEEAVLNALSSADTTGRAGRIVRALPHHDVLDRLAIQRRLQR